MKIKQLFEGVSEDRREKECQGGLCGCKQQGTLSDKRHEKTCPYFKKYNKTVKEETKPTFQNPIEVKSSNGKVIGSVWWTKAGEWEALHHSSDIGYDSIDSKDDAIQQVKDTHSEFARKRNKTVKEGQSKRALEDQISKLCTCDGDICIDPAEHSRDCPARAKLNKLGYGSELTEEFSPVQWLKSKLMQMAPNKKEFEIDKVVGQFDQRLLTRTKTGSFMYNGKPVDVKGLIGLSEAVNQELTDRIYDALKDFPELTALGLDQRAEFISKVAWELDEYSPDEEENEDMPDATRAANPNPDVPAQSPTGESRMNIKGMFGEVLSEKELSAEIKQKATAYQVKNKGTKWADAVKAVTPAPPKKEKAPRQPKTPSAPKEKVMTSAQLDKLCRSAAKYFMDDSPDTDLDQVASDLADSLMHNHEVKKFIAKNWPNEKKSFVRELIADRIVG